MLLEIALERTYGPLAVKWDSAHVLAVIQNVRSMKMSCTTMGSLLEENSSQSIEISLGRTGTARVRIGGANPLRLVAPFGTSSPRDSEVMQQERIARLVEAGADIIQELSTFGPYSAERKDNIQCSTVPYGTVLAYELFDSCNGFRGLTAARLHSLTREVFERQIEQGISYTTVHASLSNQLLAQVDSCLRQRAIPIPSRAAGILLRLMKATSLENPFYAHFDEIAELAAETGVCISLGASFRPAAVADALDKAHKLEIQAQGRLVEIAQSKGTSVMLEGLSHAAVGSLREYVDFSRANCHSVPITALGPLPTDIAAGYDHIAAAIGVVFGALAGLDLVNVVSAREHLSMPTEQDMVEAIRSAKLGAYIAQSISSTEPPERDTEMSRARAALNWQLQSQYALFPDVFNEILNQQNLQDGKPCSICSSKCPFLVDTTPAIN